MVYESDFYTTRRPYTRPTVTSYSVTRREVPWHKVPTVPRPSQVPPCFTVYGTRSLPHHGAKLPGLGKGQTYHRNIPSVAHKRLVMITPSAHGVRVKQSVILGELDRITHKIRPSLAYQPTEDYLNNHSIVSFNDETRSIRAKTAEILKRIHTPIPRAQRPLTLPGDAYYSHSELPITERIASDNYIRGLLSANKQVQHDVLTLSHYDEPTRPYSNLGRGHLACVSFAGGRPISRRRNLASADDTVRDDIKVLSHYGRFRAAASGQPHALLSDSATEYVPTPLPHRPPSKSSVTGSWKSNAPHRIEKESKQDHPAAVAAVEEYEATQDKKKQRRDAIEAAARREADEEKRRKHEVLRQDELAQQAAIERQAEMERKAREQEEAEIIAREAAEREAAEKKANEEAEKRAREEEEQRAQEEAARKEEEKKAKKEAAKKAKEEAERLAKEEAERKAREEEERKAREEEERKAREEEERKAKEEADRKAAEEAERLAKEEAERLAKEEAERLAREEEERKAKEEAERLAKEEEERKIREEEEQRAKEEQERLVQEEQERIAKESEEANTGAAEEVIFGDEVAAEPVVEEPQSPEAPVESAENPTAEEVVSDNAEEEEEEE